MHLCRLAAQHHLLLWIVPFVCGMLLSAFGARVGHRLMVVLALFGSAWTALQAGLAAVWLVLGGGSVKVASLGWMTEGPFRLLFALDADGAYAALATAVLVLLVQIYALSTIRDLVGRHRFYALLQVMLAASACMYSAPTPADAPVAFLLGWEGQALSVAFLAGFWESGLGGARAGMRWLLFQRASSLLVVLGVVLLPREPGAGLLLLILAAAIRAGLFPFHGWLRDLSEAPTAAAALFYGAGSSLPAVFLLDRYELAIAHSPFAPGLFGALGLAGIALAAVAGVGQRPERSVGAIFLIVTSFAALGFATSDPVAAWMLATAGAFSLAGLTLALGQPGAARSAATDLLHPPDTARVQARIVAGSDDSSDGIGLRASGRALEGPRWPVISWAPLLSGLSLAVFLTPPGLGHLGLGRLLSDPPAPSLLGIALRPATLIGAFCLGWLGARIVLLLAYRAHTPTQSAPAPIGSSVAPAVLVVLALASGGAALSLHGLVAGGGEEGVLRASSALAAAIFGALWGIWRGRGAAWLHGDMTRAQRLSERLAELGLGIGEGLVRLPVLVARGAGAVVWRGIGDGLIDTLLVGTAYKLIEGVGIALRLLQNGRIQRYTLVAIAAAAALVATMAK